MYIRRGLLRALHETRARGNSRAHSSMRDGRIEISDRARVGL